jgi:hypothetical protein
MDEILHQVANACSQTQLKQPNEHELTNSRIASCKHRFRIDELSAVVALGDKTRDSYCWIPDAALAKRARPGDIRWP